MTHTLHRRGNLESLKHDFVLLIMPAKGVNADGSEEKMHQIWGLLAKYENYLINFGNATTGNSHQVDIDTLQGKTSPLIHAVFKDRDVLKSCLMEIKEGNFGLSVVVSGIYEETEHLCKEINLSPHTVEYSLGVHGRTERLPPEDILEISTMCGHAMVSSNLIMHMVEEIAAGRTTSVKAAEELSRGCACGIFNPYRAQELLEKMVSITKE